MWRLWYRTISVSENPPMKKTQQNFAAVYCISFLLWNCWWCEWILYASRPQSINDKIYFTPVLDAAVGQSIFEISPDFLSLKALY
jgi:hypothetical protein